MIQNPLQSGWPVMRRRKRHSPSSASSCARPPPHPPLLSPLHSHPSSLHSRDVSMKYVQLPIEIRGPWTMKGTTGIGCTVRRRRRRRKQPRYMPGLCVVKLRRQKDTRALVCNILKPREINYPGALMNYELCLRSWKRFITSKSSLEYGEHHLISFPPWTLQIPVNYYFEFNGMFPLLCLVQRSKKHL